MHELFSLWQDSETLPCCGLASYRLQLYSIKQCSEGYAWEDHVGYATRARLQEVMERLGRHDLLQGMWSMKSDGSGVVWTDASRLALGAVVEIGGRIVKDVSWLKKKDAGAHINVAELEVVIKGLSVSLK